MTAQPSERADLWADLLPTFLDHLLTTGTHRGPVVRKTAKVYVRHVSYLARDHAHRDPWTLTATDIDDWLADKRWSLNTRRGVTFSLAAFYTWGVATGRCHWAPTIGLPTGEHKRSGPDRLPVPEAWREPLSDFLNTLRAGARSPATVDIYRLRLGILARASSDPWSVTEQHLANWLANAEWAPETKRNARSAVRGFYTWAERTGRIERSPARDLPRVLVPRALPRPAPDEALTAALARADDRQRIALKLAAYAGLRRAEIANLHLSDVTIDSIRVTGKGGHQRRIPLHPDLAEELRAEVARRRDGRAGTGFTGPFQSPTGYLFASCREPGPVTPAWLGTEINKCLPPGWTTHTLRHRFATRAYAVERDLRAVQELLGHTKPETTARYAATPEDALSRAVFGAVD